MPNVDLQSVVDAHPEPFLVIDKHYRIVAVNEAFERAQGAARRKVMGRRCYHVTHKRSRPCGDGDEACPLENLRGPHARASYSCIHAHHDERGHTHYVRVNAMPITGVDGTFYMGESLQPLATQATDGARATSLVGHAPAFLEALERIHEAARSDAPVLLTGETGTGKGLAATIIHQTSSRARGPFITLDCTTLNDNLFESEVFGHERGAFTGSVETRKGMFELADGGTLFLDEIAELSGPAQAKLLRVIETFEFRRVGGRRTRRSDVRVIAATNRDVPARIRQGLLRDDLYYRIACLPIHLPSLRERAGDIAALAAALLAGLNERSGRRHALTEEALALLQSHAFPGNVRELRNVLLAATVRAGKRPIAATDIATVLQAAPACDAAAAPQATPPASCVAPPEPTLREAEARHIAELLRRHDGRRRRVATALGISERTLYRKLKSHGLR
jgi:transcriptional regulator with PAS, ATPase and Fis domain